MMTKEIEEKPTGKNKYLNLGKPRKLPVELNSSNSFQSDSIVRNNNAPSSTSSLVDKEYRDFISCTPVTKKPFDPKNFVNSNNSLYNINSESLIKSNNTSICSISSFNDNYINKFDEKRFDNSEYIRKIEEENNKWELEINKLKIELDNANNDLLKKKTEIEELEKSNKSMVDNLNNEIKTKAKAIEQLQEKNDCITNEIQEKNKKIEEYKNSNDSMKQEIINYENKIKNSEIIIQNLKDENKSINEENLSLKEQLDILSDISEEKQRLENENAHLRMLTEEIDMKNEELNTVKNNYHEIPTLMDEIQSENSNSEKNNKQIENILQSKLSSYKFENKDLKEKIQLLENQIKELSEKNINEERENNNEKVEEIIEKVKKETQLEMIQKYDDKEKQELIQEIEQQKIIINELNYKENNMLKDSKENINKLALDKIPLLSVIFRHKIKFSLILLLAWLFGVLISFVIVEYVAYLAGDYGTCHHLTNQLFFPQALMQALTPITAKPY